MHLVKCGFAGITLLFTSAIHASSPILTLSNSSVVAGSSILITSSTPVSWTLKGSGTLSNPTALSVTYTAPASVIPQASILGCPVTPNDSVFNTRADNLPQNRESATWIGHMSTVPLTVAPAWGISYADDQTPLTNWKPYYGNNTSDYSTVYKFPWTGRGPSLKRENGNYVGVTGYENINDHHSVTVRRSDCEFFEIYNDRINGESFLCKDSINQGCNVSSINVPYGFGSATGSLGPYAMPYGSTDAAGLPLAPLSWHLDEIKAGVIKHATRFTTSIGYINGAIWPATTANAFSPSAPPYGARFLLKSVSQGGPDPNVVCLQGSEALNTDCVTMLTALQHYGMLLADIGLNNEIQAFTDLTADATSRAALNLIANARIPITSFYAVDESSLQQTVSANFQTFANGTYSVNPDNGYVTPASSAVITAVPATGTPAKVAIALQGTAVGVSSNELTIAANVSGYQIKSWVNPSTLDQSVTWTLVSGVGTVTASGVYTPPTSTISGENAMLRAVAAADPLAVTYVSVKVLTTGSSPVVGTIRIDSASEVETTDGNGNIWNSESGLEASLPTASSPDYPTWPGIEGNQYGTVLYTRGGDIAYSLIVPNGNYKVRVMYGQIFNGDVTSAPFAQSFTTNPVLVETQGNIVAHNYDWNLAANFKYQKAADIVVPAKVTDNLLSIRAMVNTPDTPVSLINGQAPLYQGTTPFLVGNSGNKSSSVNGIEVIPDTTAPHWLIDTQGATSITSGQNIQLYVVDWYSGVNDPLWTIVSGPSGISVGPTGLLSLPAGVLTNSQPVTVMASNGSFSATAVFQTPASAAPPAASPRSPAPIPPASLPPITTGFGYLRKLTIAHSQVASELVNFPVSISVTDASLKSEVAGGHVKSQLGFDIVVANDIAGTKVLPFEVESYDATLGRWTAHVQVPLLSSTTDTVIYLLYGNSNITESKAQPAAVWDSQYQAVYHFASSRALLKDSTKFSHDGSASGWSYSSHGEMGGAANVTGGSATLPMIPLLSSDSGTIELWVNNAYPEDASHNATLFQQNWFDGSPDGFYLGWTGYFNDFEVDWKTAGNLIKMAPPVDQIPTRPLTWNQVVYTWDRPHHQQALSFNGRQVIRSGTAFGAPVFTTPLSFSVPLNPSYYGVSGLLDEARFSSTRRSIAWISTSYNSQKPHSNFIRVAAETTPRQAASSLVPGSSSANGSVRHGVLHSIREVFVVAWHVIKNGVHFLA